MSPSPSSRLRVGIVVPKYGHGSVERNRVKRRLRELARTHLVPLALPLDVVIWAQRAAYGASFAALADEVCGLEPRLASVRRPA